MKMKPAIAATTLVLAVALGACKPSAPDTASEAAAPASTSTAQPAAPASSQPATMDKAQVLASGKTGLWATDGATACKARPLSRVALAWNVKDATHARVVVWFDRDGKGKERAVKNGGTVGAFTSGPWAHAGSVFVLREAGTRRELGKVTVGDKPC